MAGDKGDYEAPSVFEVAWRQATGDLDLNDDGVLDTLQDSDGDGLSDYEEWAEEGTNPYAKDSDGDGFDDKVEVDSRGGDPNDPRLVPGDDWDQDGIPNVTEEEYGLDPRSADTDGDGLRDDFEFKNFESDEVSATNPESSGRGVSDADLDPDRDGRDNIVEQEQRTHPGVADSDPTLLEEELSPEEFERMKIERDRQLAEIDAENAEIVEGEQATPDGTIRVTDPELAAKTGYAEVDGRLGQSAFVWDKRGVGQMVDGDSLPVGSTVDASGTYARGQREAKENEFGQEVVPLDAKGPPPGGEAEPDPTLAGEGEPDDGIPAGGDLGGMPKATPDGSNPLDTRTSIDSVVEDRLGGGASGGDGDGQRTGGDGGNPGQGGDGAVTTLPTGTAVTVEDVGTGFFDEVSSEPDSTPPPSSDGSPQPDPPPDTQTAAEGDDDGDPVLEGGGPIRIEEGGRVSWVDEDGNPLDEQTAAELEAQFQAEQEAAGAEGETSGGGDASGSVETTVDPDGGGGSRRGQEFEEDLGAPTGRAPEPIDPVEQGGVEIPTDVDDVVIITSDDLAQPVPGEATGGPRDVPTSDPGASSGRGGTGAIDYGPDHVEVETTGRFVDEAVPEPTDGPTTDAPVFTPVEAGTAVVADEVAPGFPGAYEPQPEYQAIPTEPGDGPLSPAVAEEPTGSEQTAPARPTRAGTKDGVEAEAYGDEAGEEGPAMPSAPPTRGGTGFGFEPDIDTDPVVAGAELPPLPIYDEDGYDQFGYDRDGYDRNGYDHDGHHRDGHSGDPGATDSGYATEAADSQADDQVTWTTEPDVDEPALTEATPGTAITVEPAPEAQPAQPDDYGDGATDEPLIEATPGTAITVEPAPEAEPVQHDDYGDGAAEPVPAIVEPAVDLEAPVALPPEPEPEPMPEPEIDQGLPAEEPAALPEIDHVEALPTFDVDTDQFDVLDP